MAWTERDDVDLTARTTDAWPATLGTEAAHVSHDDVPTALDASRDEPEVRPGHSAGER